jgi:hypothetical protein
MEENKPKGNKLVKYFLFGGCGFLIILMLAYFVGTSGWFIKNFVLPRVAKAANANITVGEISLSPFSAVEIKNLSLTTLDNKPIASFGSVSVKYSLRQIIGGNIEIGEVVLESPVINYEINEDGSSNIDKLGGAPGQPPKSTQPSKPLNLSVGSLVINNGTINFVQKSKASSTTATFNNLKLKIAGLKNGGTPSVSLSAIWNIVMVAGTNKNGIAGNAKANMDLNLDQELLPQTVKGNLDLNINAASGEFSDVKNISAALALDASMKEIKNLTLRFSRVNENLGVMSLSGTFDIAKKEADLKVNIEKVSGAVLTLIGIKSGIGITSAGLNSVIAVKAANQGRSVSVKGNLVCDKLSISKSGLQTPILDVKSQFDCAADLLNSNAVVRAFSIILTQDDKPIVELNLSKELNFNWGKASGEFGESAVNFVVSSLNLADWRGLIGANVQNGVVNCNSSAAIKNAGKSIGFQIVANVSKLYANFQSNKIQNASIDLNFAGGLNNFSELQISKGVLNLLLNSSQAFKLNCSGSADISTMAADFSISAEAQLERLLPFIPDNPNIKIHSGTFAYTGKISQQFPKGTNAPPQRTVEGIADLDDFSATIMSNKISQVSVKSDLNIVQRGDLVNIQKLLLSLNQKNRPAGQISANGSVDLKKMDADITLKLANLNQEILAAFADQYLGGRKMKSVSIDAALSVAKNSQKDSRVNGSLNIQNLLVDDPRGVLPAKPVDVKSRIDISLSPKGIADIKQMNIAFYQEGNFAGEFDGAGTYNLSNNTCQIKLNLKDINQQGLAPFIPPIQGIGDIKTISINGALQAAIDQKTDSSITGNLNITNLLIISTNKIPASRPLALVFDLSTKINPNGIISVEKFVGDIKEGGSPAGNFSLSFSYDTNSGAAAGSVKLENLNQNILKVFVNPFLNGKSLKQVSINAALTGNYKPNADSSLNGEMNISGLTITDSSGKIPESPLDIGFAVDGSLLKKIIDLRKFRISLTPTKLADNKIDITGRLNLEKTNAISGNIAVTSDSIDLTPLYSMLSAPPSKEEVSKKTAPGAPPSVTTEPPAIILPMSNFVFNAAIKRFYLKEIAITNVQVASRITGGMIDLDPCQLTLNGAPVNIKSRLNLAVPGYQYDIALNSQSLPLAPIVSSLKPELAATLNGFLYGNIAVKGAGTTGRSLRENLNGRASIALTNANIQLVSKTAKVILTPIALILGIPELLNSPVQSVVTDISIGQGNINVQRFDVQSSAFIVSSEGVIHIDDVLTNSALDFPIEFWLRSDLAKRFVLQDVQPGEYVKLPKFAQVKGTLGAPDVKIDKLKIAAITAVGIGGAAGSKAGSIIRGIGGIISGQAFSTNESKPLQPEDKLRQQPAATNSPINQLFNIFKKPRN